MSDLIATLISAKQKLADAGGDPKSDGYHVFVSAARFKELEAEAEHDEDQRALLSQLFRVIPE